MAAYEDLDYEVMEIQGQKIRVATAESLLKLKEGTIRPEDKGDALFLKGLWKGEKYRMPIEKFKSLEQRERRFGVLSRDVDYYRKVAEHFNLGWKIYQRRGPKGIFKYRSILEADIDEMRDVISQSHNP